MGCLLRTGGGTCARPFPIDPYGRAGSRPPLPVGRHGRGVFPPPPPPPPPPSVPPPLPAFPPPAGRPPRSRRARRRPLLHSPERPLQPIHDVPTPQGLPQQVEPPGRHDLFPRPAIPVRRHR